MTELKVKGNVFYLLELGNDRRIYDNEEEAIISLKKLVKEVKGLNPEESRLFEVDISGEDWEIKQIPWSKIALQLIRGGK